MDDEAPHVEVTKHAPADEVLHWYDFVCPFCYLAQVDNAALEEKGVRLVELAFNAHPEIPAGGTYVGPRSGAMYDGINRRAAATGLRLNWPDRLPNTRLALGAAEWVRKHAARAAHAYRATMFSAHFADREDIGDLTVVLRRAGEVGVDPILLAGGIDDGSTDRLLGEAETLGRSVGVNGTPAWLARGRLVTGLQPGSLYDQLALGRG